MGEPAEVTSKLLGHRLDDLTEVQLRAMLETTFVFEKRLQIRGALRQLKKSKAETFRAAEKQSHNSSTTKGSTVPPAVVRRKGTETLKTQPEERNHNVSSPSGRKGSNLSLNGRRSFGPSRSDKQKSEMERISEHKNDKSSQSLKSRSVVPEGIEVPVMNKRHALLVDNINDYDLAGEGGDPSGLKIGHRHGDNKNNCHSKQNSSKGDQDESLVKESFNDITVKEKRKSGHASAIDMEHVGNLNSEGVYQQVVTENSGQDEEYNGCRQRRLSLKERLNQVAQNYVEDDSSDVSTTEARKSKHVTTNGTDHFQQAFREADVKGSVKESEGVERSSVSLKDKLQRVAKSYADKDSSDITAEVKKSDNVSTNGSLGRDPSVDSSSLDKHYQAIPEAKEIGLKEDSNGLKEGSASLKERLQRVAQNYAEDDSDYTIVETRKANTSSRDQSVDLSSLKLTTTGEESVEKGPEKESAGFKSGSLTLKQRLQRVSRIYDEDDISDVSGADTKSNGRSAERISNNKNADKMVQRKKEPNFEELRSPGDEVGRIIGKEGGYNSDDNIPRYNGTDVNYNHTEQDEKETGETSKKMGHDQDELLADVEATLEQESCRVTEADPNKAPSGNGFGKLGMDLQLGNQKETDDVVVSQPQVENVGEESKYIDDCNQDKVYMKRDKGGEESWSSLRTAHLSCDEDPAVSGTFTDSNNLSGVVLEGMTCETKRDSGIIGTEEERNSTVEKRSDMLDLEGDPQEMDLTPHEEQFEREKEVSRDTKIEDLEYQGLESKDSGLDMEKKHRQLKTKSDSTDSGIIGDTDGVIDKTSCEKTVKDETVDESDRLDQGLVGEAVKLEDIDDEKELRKLLDNCYDFEERRKIRAAMRALKKKQQNQPKEKKPLPVQSYLNLSNGTWQSGRNKFVPQRTSTPKTARSKLPSTTSARTATKTLELSHTPKTQSKSDKMAVLDGSVSSTRGDEKIYGRLTSSKIGRSQQESSASPEENANLRLLSSSGEKSCWEDENVGKQIITQRSEIQDCSNRTDSDKFASGRFTESSTERLVGGMGKESDHLSDCDIERKNKMRDLGTKSSVEEHVVIDTSSAKDEKDAAKQRRREWQNNLLRSYESFEQPEVATGEVEKKVELDSQINGEERLLFVVKNSEIVENSAAVEDCPGAAEPRTEKEGVINDDEGQLRNGEKGDYRCDEMVGGCVQAGNESTVEKDQSVDVECDDAESSEHLPTLSESDNSSPSELRRGRSLSSGDISSSLLIEDAKENRTLSDDTPSEEHISKTEEGFSRGTSRELLSSENDASLASKDQGIELSVQDNQIGSDVLSNQEEQSSSNTDGTVSTGSRLSSGDHSCSDAAKETSQSKDSAGDDTKAAHEVPTSVHKRFDGDRSRRTAGLSRWESIKRGDKFKNLQLQFQNGFEKRDTGRKEDKALKGVKGKVSQAALLFNSPSTPPSSPMRRSPSSPLRGGGPHSPLRGLPGSLKRPDTPRSPSPTTSRTILSDKEQKRHETGSSHHRNDVNNQSADDKTLEGLSSESIYMTPPATPGSPDTFYTPKEAMDGCGSTPRTTESGLDRETPLQVKRGTLVEGGQQNTKRTKVGEEKTWPGDAEPPDEDTMAPTVEQITDETTLEKMLEEATIFEDRKKIRARLRELRKQKRDGDGGDSSAPAPQNGVDIGDGGTTVTTERKRTRATALSVNTSTQQSNDSTTIEIKPSDTGTKALSPVSPAAKTIRTDNHVTNVEEKDDGTTKTMTTTSIKTGPGMKSTQVTTMTKSDDGSGTKSASVTQETTSSKTETSSDGSKSFFSKTTTTTKSVSSSSSSTDKAAPAGKPMSKFQLELEEKKKKRAEQQKKDQEKWKSEQESRKKAADERRRKEAEEAKNKKASLMDKFGGKASSVGPVGPKRSVAPGGSRMMAQNPASIKAKLLEWSQRCTFGYKNVEISNFSSSWCDGMAFCAVVHSYFPDSFDFNKLDPKNRRENFDLAFTTAEKMADIYPLLETDDMLMMKNKPDWKCVFTYVQALYRGLSKGTGQLPS